jgi:hypothetical protein
MLDFKRLGEKLTNDGALEMDVETKEVRLLEK